MDLIAIESLLLLLSFLLFLERKIVYVTIKFAKESCPAFPHYHRAGPPTPATKKLSKACSLSLAPPEKPKSVTPGHSS